MNLEGNRLVVTKYETAFLRSKFKEYVQLTLDPPDPLLFNDDEEDPKENKSGGEAKGGAGGEVSTWDDDVGSSAVEDAKGGEPTGSRAREGAAQVAPASEWEEHLDESSGASYWYNNTTGEASWANPSG